MVKEGLHDLKVAVVLDGCNDIGAVMCFWVFSCDCFCEIDDDRNDDDNDDDDDDDDYRDDEDDDDDHLCHHNRDEVTFSPPTGTSIVCDATESSPYRM